MARRATLLAGLLILGALAAPWRRPASPGPSVWPLVAACRGGDLQVSELEPLLTDLGPGVCHEVFGLFAGRGRDADGIPVRLSREEEALLIAALRRWPAQRTVSSLVAALPPEPSLSQRLVSVRLLGETADPAAVEPLILLLSDLDPGLQQSATVQRAAARAWTVLLREGPDSLLTHLRSLVLDLPTPLYPGLVQALGELRSGRTLEVLERLSGRDPQTDALVVDAVGTIPRWDPRNLDGDAAAGVRPHLDSDHVELRRSAALAAGKLHDEEALDGLLELLLDPDARVRRAALESLQALTGARLGADPEPWQAWVEAEDSWHLEHSPDLVQQARSGQPAAAVAALRELSAHPLRAEFVARDLEPVLGRAEAEVVVAACGALARLRAGTGVRPLVDLLADPRAEVRDAAHAALRATTGADLPAEVEAWQAWLADPR